MQCDWSDAGGTRRGRVVVAGWASLVSLAGFGAAPAGAAVIVSDTFANVASGSGINGRTPETTALGTTTWVAPSANFLGDGSGRLSANSAFGNTALIDLGAGYLSANPGVYSLSFDFTQPSAVTSQSWIGLGFAQGVAAGGVNAGQNFVDNRGAPWALFRQNGQEIAFAGPANTNAVLTTATGAVATGTTHTFELRLDTSLAAWTMDAFLDGTQQDLNGAAAGNTFTFAANPTGSRYVGMSTGVNGDGAIGTVDNFSLTGPVPEPTGAALIAIAAAAFGVRRRRR